MKRKIMRPKRIIRRVSNLYVNLSIIGLVTIIGCKLNEPEIGIQRYSYGNILLKNKYNNMYPADEFANCIMNLSVELEKIKDNIKIQEEKKYSGMALSNEYEDYLLEKCKEYQEEYELDMDSDELLKIILTIGEQESNGSWNTNGVVSSTNDYGQFQINKCNHKYIYDELGYTRDEILNDEYKNADAAIWLICDNILSNKKCETIEDVFGMYNGWLDWENKSQSVRYKNSCIKILDNYFSEEGYVKEIKKN